MSKLEVLPLETDGCAIVSVDTAAALRLEYDPRFALEETTTWGEFRTAGHPFGLAAEAVGSLYGDIEEYIEALEAANGVAASNDTLEERWRSACEFAEGPSPDSDAPADADVFEYHDGQYGARMDFSLALQAAMLDDLPSEVIDEFDLYYESTLDGALGRVDGEELDAVCTRLVELGFEIE